MQRIFKTLVVVVAVLLLAGCRPVSTPVAAPAADADAATVEATAEAGTMDHGSMGEMDHGAVGEAPFDAQFIDGMIMHHQGAIAMAQQALDNAEHAEVRQMAEGIISAQEAEIGQMEGWRAAWYPDLPQTMGMGMDMGMMEVPNDSATPFDQRFLEGMIDHHQGAIEMATAALDQAEHQEVRDLAQAIISAQQAEIEQMRGWLSDWYGVQ